MERKYTSDEFMLDLLQRVQPLQIEVLEKGYHCHVDAGNYDSYEKHISFDFTVFGEDLNIMRQFDFSAIDTREELEAVFVSLIAYVNTL